MNIVLTGLRGSGKSTIGKILSEKLKMNFVDIDHEIENKAQTKIKDIVANHGWEVFRQMEKDVTAEISKLSNTIISTGGGTIIAPENRKALNQSGKIIYLYVKPEVAVQRIQNDPNRPALTNQETLEQEIAQLYRERNGLYCESAFHILERTDDPEHDSTELIKILFPNHED